MTRPLVTRWLAYGAVAMAVGFSIHLTVSADGLFVFVVTLHDLLFCVVAAAVVFCGFRGAR